MNDLIKARVDTRDWLKDSLTLEDFLWSAQPHVVEPLVSWLKDWIDWKHGETDKPAPFLHLFGPFTLGKTQLSYAITRYLIFNIYSPAAEYIYWPEYVKDQLNGQKLEINWQARIMILDDFDGRRVIPKSMSTWMLEDMLSIIKPRGIRGLPTIIITNRELIELEGFFARPSEGKANEDTEFFSNQVMEAISRYTYASLGFRPLDGSGLNDVRYHTQLREQARQTNDLQALGFYYPREKYDIEVSF